METVTRLTLNYTPAAIVNSFLYLHRHWDYKGWISYCSNFVGINSWEHVYIAHN